MGLFPRARGATPSEEPAAVADDDDDDAPLASALQPEPEVSVDAIRAEVRVAPFRDFFVSLPVSL
jgi:hypothetical protein